ncbi:hypothetical protein LTSEBAI_3917, partial [Salmonella enterica subsp. enterica serovar Baildon str. R6-199]
MHGFLMTNALAKRAQASGAILSQRPCGRILIKM